jgi:hypothetical protein
LRQKSSLTPFSQPENVLDGAIRAAHATGKRIRDLP